MRANEYKVLEQAVAEGVSYGWNRAHKHGDNAPDPATIRDIITDNVMNEICEWFSFPAPEED